MEYEIVSKSRKNEEEITVKVFLDISSEGELYLRTSSGYDLLRLNYRGELELCEDIGEETGLSLDSNGRIILDK